jgi:hypothetical protein
MGEPQARQEEDVIRTRRLVAVGIAAMVVFTIGVLAARWEQVVSERGDLPTGRPRIPAEVHQSEVGIVYQRTFEELAPGEGQRLHARQAEQLASYGWVDPGRGIIHVPIDLAMRRYLEGARP